MKTFDKILAVFLVIAVIVFALWLGNRGLKSLKPEPVDYDKIGKMIDERSDQTDESQTDQASEINSGSATDNQPYDDSVDYVNSRQCPTNADVAEQLDIPVTRVVASHGFDVASWEGCKWQVQGPTLTITADSDFVLTYTVPDGTEPGAVRIRYGDGEPLQIYGATVRYLPSYRTSARNWVLNPQKLFEAEYDYGMSQTPQYATCPDYEVNFSSDQQAACG